MLICNACSGRARERGFIFRPNRQSCPLTVVDLSHKVPPVEAPFRRLLMGGSPMRRLHVIFILVLIPVWAGPAHAQLFGKRLKANPVQRVPELIMIVKTDADERKRAAAADELRDYDSKQFPE